MYERLEELLASRNITAAKLARDIGISRSTITMWKSGKIQPNSAKLQLIADYFGVSLDYLLGKSTENNKTYSDEVNQCADLFSQLPKEWQEEYLRRMAMDLELLKKK